MKIPSHFGKLVHKRVHSLTKPFDRSDFGVDVDRWVDAIYKSLKDTVVPKRLGEVACKSFIRGFIDGHSYTISGHMSYGHRS